MLYITLYVTKKLNTTDSFLSCHIVETSNYELSTCEYFTILKSACWIFSGVSFRYVHKRNIPFVFIKIRFLIIQEHFINGTIFWLTLKKNKSQRVIIPVSGSRVTELRVEQNTVWLLIQILYLWQTSSILLGVLYI